MRTDTLAHKLGPYVHRLAPRSLRGRLAFAAVVCSLVSVWVTYSVANVVVMREFRDLTERAAGGHVDAFGAFVRGQRDELGGLTNAVSEGVAARGGPAPSIEGTNGTAWIGRALTFARCPTLVLVDANGRAVYTTGTPSDVEALLAVVARETTPAASGLAWSDQLLVVAVRVVHGEGGSRAGYLAAARPLEPAVHSRFLPLDDGLELSFVPAAATPVSGGMSRAGFSGVRTRVRADGTSYTLAEMPGLVTRSAATAELIVRDERLVAGVASAQRSALATALLVSVLGTAVGLALAGAVRRPIERTRVHLRDGGRLALEGVLPAPGRTRPETATEFIGLAQEVDGLLHALSNRHNELKTATEKARRAEDALRAALDDSPEMKLLVEGRDIAVANKSAERLIGLPADEIVGMDSQDVMDFVGLRMEDGTPMTVETALAFVNTPVVVTFATRGGEQRWGEVMTIPHEADPNRVLISARDITEQRRLEALREEIFSLVSHDLRAPLTVVQGYLDILERPLQPEARERALESARHNARKMADLLEDLLDATAPEELLRPKASQPVSLAAVAKDVVSSMQTAAHEHSIVLLCDQDALVLGEERRLRQAAVNLVSNAIKYSPGDTTVTVRVLRRGGLAVLAVEDEGPGVPAEARDTVFTRYGRLASTERKPGLGLGLYIVRIVAETHGGTARVEDAPGGGARFLVELPLATETAPAEPSAAAPAGPVLERETDEPLAELGERDAGGSGGVGDE